MDCGQGGPTASRTVRASGDGHSAEGQWDEAEVEDEDDLLFCVLQSDFNQFTWQYHFYPEWQCLVCKVGFTPIERYRKHLGSLFHLRKCAGEDIQWVEGGGYHF